MDHFWATSATICQVFPGMWKMLETVAVAVLQLWRLQAAQIDRALPPDSLLSSATAVVDLVALLALQSSDHITQQAR
jgi:hypothetical protein